VPVSFLTNEHLRRYGRYNTDPNQEQLAEHFVLSDELKTWIEQQAVDPQTRLGLAVQVCTLKFLGTFLTDLNSVPSVVVRTTARQIGVSDTRLLRQYARQRNTRTRHAARIRAHLGYKRFEEGSSKRWMGNEMLHALRWLYAKLLVGDERPIVLFDLLTKELVDRRVVLPGASVLERLVTRVRERVANTLYRDLARKLNPAQVDALEALLIPPVRYKEDGSVLAHNTAPGGPFALIEAANPVGTGSRLSPLERLRSAPTRFNAPALLLTLTRLEQIRAVGVGEIDLSHTPESRLWSLSRVSLVAWAQTIAKFAPARRQASLLAVVQHLERSASDDVLEVFDALMNSLGLKSQRKWRTERLRNLGDVDASALLMRDALRVLHDPNVPADQVRTSVYAQYPQNQLLEADRYVTELASPAGGEEAQAWLNATNTISKFIVPFLSNLKFEGSTGAKSLLAAMGFIVSTHGKSKVSWGKAPLAFIPKGWLSHVCPRGEINRSAYLVCVAHQLQQALKRREVFVIKSLRHGDPRAQLLEGERWEEVRNDVLRALNLSREAKPEIEALSKQVSLAYSSVLENLEQNSFVRFEKRKGKLLPVITPLEALPESPSFKALDLNLSARFPEIDLSELLLEINARTGFIAELLMVAESQPRREDFMISVCAVLVSQACNIGLKAVSQANHPALNLARLAWVQQNYVRADTLLRANAKLVEDHSSLPLTKRWGGGEVASADGLRFVVPVRSLHTGANSRYFGSGRGITYYTLTSDQYTQLHGIVIPGTLRDSLYILSTLLEQQTSLEPREIMTDTAAYSDVVFGLFHLLGYQFSPRIKDVGDSRYWRFDRKADYGPLNDAASGTIKTALIAEHWEDILRVVGSLKLGTVKAPDILRALTHFLQSA
jgi:hypothetical protein